LWVVPATEKSDRASLSRSASRRRTESMSLTRAGMTTVSPSSVSSERSIRSSGSKQNSQKIGTW
jgi:hypothetical protein